MRPVVLGAAGFLGLNLVDELVRAGFVPRCGRRKRTNVLGLLSRKVPMVQADLDDGVGLRTALDGADVVYHLAGHYPRHALDRTETLRTGVSQMWRVLDAAADAGVKRLVYVSSTATVAPAPSGASDERHVFAAPPGFGVYHDLKWEMEQAALAEERLEVVVACPAACLGAFDLRVATSAMLVGLARGIDPPHPDGVVSIVDASDVGRALVALGTHPSPPRRVLLSGGSHGLHDLLVRLADRYGVAAPSAAMSADDAIAHADAEERRAVTEGGRAGLSREIADLVVHGVPIDASLAEASLGLAYSPLDATLDRFDAWARRMRLIPASPAGATTDRHLETA